MAKMDDDHHNEIDELTLQLHRLQKELQSSKRRITTLEQDLEDADNQPPPVFVQKEEKPKKSGPPPKAAEPPKPQEEKKDPKLDR